MIVEFAGLPRSGKSTNIDITRHYFSRRGVAVKVIGEAIRFCPFGICHRVEIACWAANYALNAVLDASLDIDPKMLTLQDRGLFDALTFLRLLWREGFITESDLSRLNQYFADRRWTQHVDLVILFDVEPQVALGRDLAQQIAQELHEPGKNFDGLPGLITNELTLQTLQDCYRESKLAFRDRFRIRSVHNSMMPIDAAKEVVKIIKTDLGI